MINTDNILESWQKNAGKWIATIDGKEIESRVIATNYAIVNIIREHNIKNILDIGCGEGWLTRALLDYGIEAFGIDGVADLIANAKEKGGDHYSVCTYQDFVLGKLADRFFESAVINFSLLDKNDTEAIIHYLPTVLKKRKLLFIQTLHPLSLVATNDYFTGWKEGSWNGLKQNFVQPYKWWFRTMEDWVNLFRSAGFVLIELKEPFHPTTNKPLSVIFVLQCK